jgi:hypothetical protein
VHRVHSYLNGVVAEIPWAERLSEWNHIPHFPSALEKSGASNEEMPKWSGKNCVHF